MPNFDFHSNLSPYEFECLIRDILEIRDAPLKFRTYRRGKDGGIDFKCINSPEKIIGQAKLYKNDYRQLKLNLLTELIKVRKQKPSRYLLATSVSLGPKQTEEILALFKGYLSERDIIDGEQLNKYLGQPAYLYLLRTYSKLLVPDLNVLEVFLDDTINRDIINRTKRELKEIARGRQVFVQGKAFKQALDRLEENKVVIISGNPGVGKTTLAHMLVNYFVFEYGKEIDFVYCKSLEEIDRSYKAERKQVFLWDDFWGQKFDEVPGSPGYFNSFAKLVRSFGTGKQHYLVITSREYIIKKVSSAYDKELSSIIDFNKFILNVEAYSEEDRLRIFLNHLYFSDFEKEYFYDLEYAGPELENIIDHENYSPRHIDYFIKFIYTDDFKAVHRNNSQAFLRSFLKYLNKPHEFWAEIFEKQSPAAQLILITLLISSDPMTNYELRLSFLAYQAPARKVLGLQVQPLDFGQELDRLEELFIRTEELYEAEDVLIYFQSPGIKDFLLEYLRKRIDQYAKVLIPHALFFNQLNFVFTTLGGKDKIEDSDSDTVLYGTKILLDGQAQQLLKQKVLSDLHQLRYSVDSGKGFSWNLDRYDSIADIKYRNLWQLNKWFPLYLQENEDVKQFVIAEVIKDIERYNSGKSNRLVACKAMDAFPLIIELCKDDIPFDQEKLISAYYSSICYTKDFLSFNRFRKIFPAVFMEVTGQHIHQIRAAIRSQILEDIDQFQVDGLIVELETLLFHQIDEVFHAFGMRITPKFEMEIEAASEWTFSFGRKKNSKKRKKQVIFQVGKTYGKPKFSAILSEYAVVNDEFKPISFLKEFYRNDKRRYHQLLALYESKDHLLEYYFENAESVLLLDKYLPVKSTDHFSFHSYLIQDILRDMANLSGLNSAGRLYDLFAALSVKIYAVQTRTTTRKNVQHLFSKYISVAEVPDISLLAPILVKRGNWYEFLNTGMLYFFFLKWLQQASDHDYAEILKELAEEAGDGKHELILLIERYDQQRFQLGDVKIRSAEV